MWHEGVGGRGSSEIASCLMKFINTLPETVNHLIMYSDTCGGQNRNQHLSAMFMHLVSARKLIIDQIFMESGHSQMECDSAHSSIESCVARVNVYAPTDYYRLASVSRRTKPFQVVVMDSDDFVNCQELSKSIIRNRNKDVNGETVQWLQVKHFQYSHQHPFMLLYKYHYSEEFKQLNVRLSLGLRSKKEVLSQALTKLYNEPNTLPAISVAKYNDLMYLCTSLAIPRDYHAFYSALRHSSSSRDAVTEPEGTEADLVHENS